MRLPSALVIAAAVALSALTPLLAGDTAPVKIPTLAEVHTWGELLAQKPIAASSGSTYLLGIDRTHADLLGGALLYCLVKGPYDPEKANDLGPFSVDIKAPKPGSSAEQEMALGVIQSPKAPMYLLLKIIPLTRQGEFTITIREPMNNPGDKDDKPGKDAPSRPVAATKITVSKKFATPWMIWDEPEDDIPDADAQNKKAEEGHYAWADVTSPVNVAALPDWPRGQSIPIPALPTAKLPLPTLFPAAPDPGIHLAIDGNWLIAKFDKPISTVSATQEHFLVRWWVNGKLFIPKEFDLVAFPSASAQQAEMPQPLNEVRFRIKLRPELLHIKKGDTLGVQLLHCPKGCSEISIGETFFLFSQPDDTDPALSRLSPRLEFTYTGNPVDMASVASKH